ncbi:MAG: hypothetical protein HYS98_06525 [Deltaproteobacteria bacterium]|nr:hypothetical protein [Deltaproteobacteria bacterium]
MTLFVLLLGILIFITWYCLHQKAVKNNEVENAYSPIQESLHDLNNLVTRNNDYFEQVSDADVNPFLVFGKKNLEENQQSYQTEVRNKMNAISGLLVPLESDNALKSSYQTTIQTLNRLEEIQSNMIHNLTLSQFKKLKEDHDALLLERFRWKQEIDSLFHKLSLHQDRELHTFQKKENVLSYILMSLITFLFALCLYLLLENHRKSHPLKEAYAQIQSQSIHLEFLSKYYKKILDSIPMALIISNMKNEISDSNTQAQKLFQLNPKHTGQDISRIKKFIPLQSWIKSLNPKQATVIENITFQERLYDITLWPLHNDLKNQNDTISIFEDVTEKNFYRQKTLQNERLATAGRMAAQIAHEIRNPLNSLQLNVEYLRECLEKNLKKDPSLFPSILSQLERLKQLTSDYLGFAKMPPHKKKKVCLKEVLADLLHFYKNDHIKIHYMAFEKNLPLIAVDPEQLKSAFLNILKNAEEASAQNCDIHITLKYNSTHKCIDIFFKDFGSGVEATHRDKIFLPFYSTKAHGTGLGLALTQQILYENNAQIEYSPNQPQGSIFKVSFPIQT